MEKVKDISLRIESKICLIIMDSVNNLFILKYFLLIGLQIHRWGDVIFASAKAMELRTFLQLTCPEEWNESSLKFPPNFKMHREHRCANPRACSANPCSETPPGGRNLKHLIHGWPNRHLTTFPLQGIWSRTSVAWFHMK